MNGALPPATDRIRRGALVVGTVGFALSLAGAWFDRQQFFLSYLFSYLFWLGISLGGLGVVMMHHLTGGGWGYLIRRPLEAAMGVLPLMAVLFIPLIFGLQDLYVWARPEALAQSALLQQKEWYLNVPFFLARAAVYFIVWLVLAYWLNKWSSSQDRTADPYILLRLQRLSAFGEILYTLTVTFAAVDWVMSLVPEWKSTAFGLVVGIGQMLAAMAFAIVAAAWFSRTRPLAEVATPGRFQDLGNLLLTFIMTWAYLAFSQFLIIWAENLPEEIGWYVPRIQTSWQWLGLFLVAFHFAVPFAVLLSRQVKRAVNLLAVLAALVLGVHLADAFWLVVPTFRPTGVQLHWTDIVTPLGIGGLWLSAVLWLIRRRPLVPLQAAAVYGVAEHGG